MKNFKNGLLKFWSPRYQPLEPMLRTGPDPNYLHPCQKSIERPPYYFQYQDLMLLTPYT